MFDIHRLPAFNDNYLFLLHDPQAQTAAVVDPGDARPVLDCLDSLGAELVAIFNTHHHSDHIGGNQTLLARYPQLTVYAGAEEKGRIPGQQVELKEGDRVSFGGREAVIYFIPGHTRAHIAYYFAPTQPGEIGELFCGDTIFSAGCGRLFEGTPAQMVNSITKLRVLPDDTRIWCAHEYTLGNLKFALTVEPNNEDLQKRWQEVNHLRSQGEATIPTWLGIEKRTNPFLRWDTPSLKQAMGLEEPSRVFGKLRGMKDNF